MSFIDYEAVGRSSEVVRVFPAFLSRGLLPGLSRRQTLIPRHRTGVVRTVPINHAKAALDYPRSRPDGRSHPSDPPRRPFVRPRLVTPRCHSPRPSSELTRTGPPCPIDRSRLSDNPLPPAYPPAGT